LESKLSCSKIAPFLSVFLRLPVTWLIRLFQPYLIAFEPLFGLAQGDRGAPHPHQRASPPCSGALLIAPFGFCSSLDFFAGIHSLPFQSMVLPARDPVFYSISRSTKLVLVGVSACRLFSLQRCLGLLGGYWLLF